MAGQLTNERLLVWYDAEGDYLEVLFKDRLGYFTETEDDRVMARVDLEGNVVGFSILGIASIKDEPLRVELPSAGG